MKGKGAVDSILASTDSDPSTPTPVLNWSQPEQHVPLNPLESLFSGPDQSQKVVSFGMDPLVSTFQQAQGTFFESWFTNNASLPTVDPEYMFMVNLEPSFEDSFDTYFTPMPMLPSPETASSAQTGLEDVETHLLNLSSIFNAGISCEDGLVAIGTIFRKTPLGENLKRALCYHSCFWSTHPDLFGGKSPQNITFADRLQVANERFSIPTDCSIRDYSFSSNREVCDEIRALTVHLITQFSIGNGDRAIELISKTFYLARAFGILHPTTFGAANASSVTIDDIANIISQLSSPAYAQGPINECERADRLLVLEVILTADTYASLASGRGFILDDNEFPEMNFTKMNVSFTAQPIPETLGKHTLWEKTPFAPNLDADRATNCQAASIDALYFAETQLRFMKFFRKIIRFSRQQRYGLDRIGSFSHDQVLLHNTTLQVIQDLGSINLFSSLVPFLWGNPESRFPEETKRTISNRALISSFRLLTMITYLHFPTISYPERKFPLTTGGSSVYTSRDIMYAVVRAVHFLVQKAMTPIVPKSGKLNPLLQTAMNSPLPDDLSSPMLSHGVMAMMIFIISMSAAVGFLAPHADQMQTKSLVFMLHDLNKSLSRTGSVWMGSKYFHMQLTERLKAYPASWLESWAGRILHYIQSEWRNFERERNEWEIERSDLKARLALLEGERRAMETLKTDLVKRVKMLEFALKTERYLKEAESLLAATKLFNPPRPVMARSFLPLDDDQNVPTNGNGLVEIEHRSDLVSKPSINSINHEKPSQEQVDDFIETTVGRTRRPDGQLEEGNLPGNFESLKSSTIKADKKKNRTASKTLTKGSVGDKPPRAPSPGEVVPDSDSADEASSEISNYTTTAPSVMQAALSTDGHKKWIAQDPLRSHYDSVRSIAFHPTEPAILSGSEDRTVKLWRLSTTPQPPKEQESKLVHTFRGHTGAVTSVAVSAIEDICFSGGMDSVIRVWSLPSLAKSAYLPHGSASATHPRYLI
ncbi:hypothetical protein HDU91_003418 [Kappamyces sp. JEL0680]|nr:hypothetical protein HDU91_003418 [Kappamyces sp. JEL0680]